MTVQLTEHQLWKGSSFPYGSVVHLGHKSNAHLWVCFCPLYSISLYEFDLGKVKDCDLFCI